MKGDGCPFYRLTADQIENRFNKPTVYILIEKEKENHSRKVLLRGDYLIYML